MRPRERSTSGGEEFERRLFDAFGDAGDAVVFLDPGAAGVAGGLALVGVIDEADDVGGDVVAIDGADDGRALAVGVVIGVPGYDRAAAGHGFEFGHADDAEEDLSDDDAVAGDDFRQPAARLVRDDGDVGEGFELLGVGAAAIGRDLDVGALDGEAAAGVEDAGSALDVVEGAADPDGAAFAGGRERVELFGIDRVGKELGIGAALEDVSGEVGGGVEDLARVLEGAADHGTGEGGDLADVAAVAMEDVGELSEDAEHAEVGVVDVDHVEVAFVDFADDLGPFDSADGADDGLDHPGKAAAHEPWADDGDVVAAGAEAGCEVGRDGGDVVDFGDTHAFGRAARHQSVEWARTWDSHSRV